MLIGGITPPPLHDDSRFIQVESHQPGTDLLSPLHHIDHIIDLYTKRT